MNRARAITGGQAFVPFSVGGTAATLDMDFQNAGYVGATPSVLTVTRTGVSTSGLFTDATGSSYTVFAPNTARIVSGLGLLREEPRTQYLGVTDTPATQTTTSLGTGSYTLWVIGSGSATSSAGTATITGGGAATAGTPNVFTVTVAGTVTVTVSGSLTRFQLENGTFATSYIPNLGAAGTTVARGTESVSLTGANFTSWFTNASTYTFYADGTLRNTTALEPSLGSADDGSTANAVRMTVAGGSGRGRVLIRSGAASVADLTSSGTSYLNAAVKIATAVTVNDFAASFNGETAAVDTAGAVPVGMTQLQIGTGAGSNFANSYIRRFTYFPARLTNAQLQGLTA